MCICWWMWLITAIFIFTKFHAHSEGKAVPVNAMKANRGSRGIAPLILNLGNGWMPSVSRPVHFTPGIWPRYPLNRGLGDGLSVLEKRRRFVPAEIRTLDRWSRCLVAIPTEPSRFTRILRANPGIPVSIWEVWGSSFGPQNRLSWPIFVVFLVCPEHDRFRPHFSISLLIINRIFNSV